MKSFQVKGLILLLAGLLCIGCAEKKAPHVIFIGVDGWSAAEWDEAEMPFIKGLQAESAWTLDKRTICPTASAINWTTLITGAPSEYHGRARWNSVEPDFAPATPDGAVPPTVFRLNRERWPEAKMGVFYDWDVIGMIVDSTAVDELHFYDETREADWQKAADIKDFLKKEQPDLSLFYFGMVDHTGHTYGWKSPEYREYLHTLDSLVATVFDGIREAGLADDTVVIMTTDHGGFEKSHGGKYVDDVMKTPLLIWGKGVKKGYQITAPTIQMDIPATIVWLRDLAANPAMTGRPLKEAFE